MIQFAVLFQSRIRSQNLFWAIPPQACRLLGQSSQQTLRKLDKDDAAAVNENMQHDEVDTGKSQGKPVVISSNSSLDAAVEESKVDGVSDGRLENQLGQNVSRTYFELKDRNKTNRDEAQDGAFQAYG